MMIDRRTFLVGSACVAVPAVVNLLSPLTLVPDSLSPQPASDANGLTFGIAGWSRPDDGASEGPVSSDPGHDQVWISISQSWRAAWR
jgi:hypothetical protein